MARHLTEINMIPAIIALAVIGVFAVALEVFLPGGVLGVVGGIALLACIGLILFSDDLEGIPFSSRLLISCGVLGAAGAALAFGLKFFPKSPIGRRLTLREAVGGGQSEPDPLRALVGRTGTAACRLRPSGTAVIDGRRIDVVAMHGALIEPGESIRVAEVRGGGVYVEKVAHEAP